MLQLFSRIPDTESSSETLLRCIKQNNKISCEIKNVIYDLLSNDNEKIITYFFSQKIVFIQLTTKKLTIVNGEINTLAY